MQRQPHQRVLTNKNKIFEVKTIHLCDLKFYRTILLLFRKKFDNTKFIGELKVS